jgi:chromosomal replication initiator protein
MDNEKIWQAVLAELEIGLSRINFNTWFKDTFLVELNDKTAIVGVPSAFVKKWLEEKYYKNILKSLEKILDKELNDLVFKVELKINNKNDNLNEINLNKQNSVFKIQKDSFQQNKESENACGLNLKYSFNTFVVGKANELAYAACKAVVNSLGKAYNPLFIYGGVGLGKTHLLQAIGNEIKDEKRVLYTTSEKFTNNYIQAVHTGKAKDFKNIYRKVDLLLVDDVQFMGGKDGTQEEFFHTFNELQQDDKQIVLSSDRPPKAMPAIEKRLISRFESGMVADIGKPDLETKIAILENKAKEKGFVLDSEIINFISNNVQNNIRELEGALNKVIVFHQMSNSKPTIISVQKVLGDYISTIQSRSLSAKDIIEATAKFYDISYKDLIGNSRKKELVWPRQIAIFLIREETQSSYPSIGDALGGRDHTTAMHAYNKINTEVKEKNNGRVKQEIESIKQLLNSDIY